MNVEGRTKKSIYNVSFNVANQIISLLLTFISRTVFIQVLGVELLGVNSLFSDVLSLLSMADLGFGTAMAYSFYKPLADNDENKVAALVQFYKKVYRVIAAVVTVLGLAVVPFLDLIVTSDNDIPHLEIYYLFALSNVVVSYLFVYKTSVLNANQMGYQVTKISIWTNALKTVLQIVVLLVFKNFILYLLVGTIFAFVNNFIASRKASQLYPFINDKTVQLSRHEQKDIFRNLGSVFVYKVSSVLLTATDNILISSLVGISIVGYYSNYNMISTKITTLISLLFTSVTASIGNLIVTSEKQKRYSVFKAEQSLSFILSLVVIPCYSSLANNFITVWLGSEFVLSPVTVAAISLNMYLSTALQPLWSYREATGMYRQTRWVMLIAAIVNLFLSIVLGLLIGLPGILFASAISRVSTYVWYEPKLLFKQYFDASVSEYFKPLILNCIACVLVSILLSLMFSSWEPTGYLGFFIKGVVCFTIALVIAVILYRKTDGMKVLLSKVEKIIPKNIKNKS